MNMHELEDAYRAGRATITFDEAYSVVGVARATFYRCAAAGEVPGVLKLGRKRLLSLPAFLAWISGEQGPPCHCSPSSCPPSVSDPEALAGAGQGRGELPPTEGE